MYFNICFITFSMILFCCPIFSVNASPNRISASKLTSYPIIVSDIQASDLFDAHFPVFLTVNQTKVQFSRTEWTKSIIFDKLAFTLNHKFVEKFCVNFPEDGAIEFTKDDQSISVLLLKAIKEDNHLVAFQC